jgi:hypothetical protein
MPTDVTAEFCRDPEGFMRDNIVMQWIQHDRDEVISVGVKQIDDAVIDNKARGKVCYFYLKPSAPALSVYWCPYQQNKLKSAMLGNDALFALTVAVTGCSVGLGSGSNGAQMMCHANSAEIGTDWKPYGDAVSAARQAESQDAQLRYKLGQGATIASPVQYKATDTDTMVTFFGVHGLGMPWHLYGLSYRKVGGNRYFHGGVNSY